ncbi:MAG: aminoglycoside phosphotransferase family protein [Alphaproteobacteria bacterium]
MTYVTETTVGDWVQSCTDKWSLQQVEPLTETPRGWLFTCISPDGPAVLKLHSEEGDDDLRATDIMLGHWQGQGAIALLQQDGPAALLERADGSRNLCNMVRDGQDIAACEVIATVASSLQNHPAPQDRPAGVITLADRFAPLSGPVPDAASPELEQAYAKAMRISDHLLGTADTPTLLHGDLHHENVLDAGPDRGWLAIDPKGYWGEACYELANPMVNPTHYTKRIATPDILTGRAAFYADRLGYDPDRLLQCALVEAAVISRWCLEVFSDYDHFAIMALALEPLVKNP